MPEIKWLILGVFSATIMGLAQPIVGLLMSEMINILSQPNNEDFRNKADLFCLGFLIIAIVQFFVMVI